MYNYNTIKPPQKISSSKKNKKWGEANVDYFISMSIMNGGIIGGTRKGDILLSYRLYNSEFDHNDFKYVTNPFNVEDGFPAKVQDINIIKPKIDLLIGEEIKRPDNLRVINTSPEAADEMLEQKKQMLLQHITEMLNGGKPVTEEEKPLTLPEIEKYIRYNYKSIPEETANYLLKYLKELLNLDNEFTRCFKDLAVSSNEIAYIGAVDDSPFVERVNPLYFDFDKSPELQFIEDGEWAVREMKMSATNIHDRYHEKMTEQQLNELLDLIGEHYDTGQTYPNERKNKVWELSYLSDPNKETYRTSDLQLYHVVWRSYKKIGWLTITDEQGQEQVIVVDDTYKVQDGDQIEWEWVDEIWEGYKVGDIYFGIQPIEYQANSVSAAKNKKLPYIGVIFNGDNTKVKSLPILMKSLQYMYIVIWYRIELALARDKGKVINMDITQIPKGLGIDVNQWMHYLSALGVNFINPYDEGWDIPGRTGGNPSPYNQITSIDLTSAQAINEYINLLQLIEEMIGEISGVSKQREGQVTQSSLVGTTNRAVIQSSHITELLFWYHTQFKKNVYSQLLEVAKNVYTKPGNNKLHFILNDVGRVFLEVTEDFVYSDFAVFISNTQKEVENIELMKQLLQPAMQNGATLGDVADILTSNNVDEIKNKLRDIEAKRMQMAQEAQKAEQQMKEAELQMKEKELLIKEEDSVRQAQTDIAVAEIQAESKQGGEKELAKIQADLAIKQADIELKRDELDLKEKELDEDVRLKEKELNQEKELRSKEISVKNKQATKSKTN